MSIYSHDLNNGLIASNVLEAEKRSHEKTSSQLMHVLSQLHLSLTIFETRFESDSTQISYPELEWYERAAMIANSVTGRAHILDKVTRLKYDLIMGNDK